MQGGHPWYYSPSGLLLVLILLALASCGDTDCEVDDPTQPSSLPVICPGGMALTITKLNLPMGRQAKVGVVGGHSSCRVTWTIDDFGIIGANTSNATAVVTGLVVGETTIHAYRGSGTDGPTSACSVTVLDNTYSSLTVVPDSVMLDAGTPSIGEILNLEILDTEGQVVQPINPVVWTNSDTTVVDVMGILDTMAVLKVIAGGRAVITATYDGPGATEKALSDTCLVTVTPAGGS